MYMIGFYESIDSSWVFETSQGSECESIDSQWRSKASVHSWWDSIDSWWMSGASHRFYVEYQYASVAITLNRVGVRWKSFTRQLNTVKNHDAMYNQPKYDIWSFIKVVNQCLKKIKLFETLLNTYGALKSFCPEWWLRFVTIWVFQNTYRNSQSDKI